MIELDGIEVKVGDRLWDAHLGWVEIIRIFDETYPYPQIEAASRLSGNKHIYTKAGSYYNNAPRCLFWDEVKIDPPPKPKRMVKREGWIKFFRDLHGEIAIHGTQMFPRIFNSPLPFEPAVGVPSPVKIEWEEEVEE